MSANYEAWRESPEGRLAIQMGMDKAKADVEAYIERRRFESDQAMQKWIMQSNYRAHENQLHGMLGKHSGRIDDTYMAEVPLTIGYNSHEDGVSLAYVSLGGVDVSAYLPPDVLEDIRNHIALCAEDEIGRTE